MRHHALVIVCLLVLVSAGACARPVRMTVVPQPLLDCRTPASNAGEARLTWIRPESASERRALDEKCAQVGPPLLVRGAPSSAATVTHVALVTWNLHDGRGDVTALLRDLRAGSYGAPAPDAVVFLLQEYVRPTPGDGAPGGTTLPLPGWHLAYVPARPTTLRDGDATTKADRGTAILSSLPLDELEAIELPLERQRRVALAATVRGVTTTGRRWRARVVSAHLENRPGAGRLWVRAGAARTRQAEALLDALDLEPGDDTPPRADALILGADLNTWLGRHERAWRLLRDAFPTWSHEDVRPTIGFRLRVDHLFARLPEGTRAIHRRVDARYGSDHHPVVAAIDFGANPHERAAPEGRPPIPMEP